MFKAGGISTRLEKTKIKKLKTKIISYKYKEEYENETIKKQINDRAAESGAEFIAESVVQYIGTDNPTRIAKSIFKMLLEEWRK